MLDRKPTIYDYINGWLLTLYTIFGLFLGDYLTGNLRPHQILSSVLTFLLVGGIRSLIIFCRKERRINKIIDMEFFSVAFIIPSSIFITIVLNAFEPLNTYALCFVLIILILLLYIGDD